MRRAWAQEVGSLAEYKLLPGKVVRAVLFSRNRKRGMTLPLSAVLHDGKQTFVYVNEKKRAKKVLVKPGLTFRNRPTYEFDDE